MNPNPLLALTDLGQSIWIDHLDRSRIASGQVRRHITEDGLRGMTSNPTIFEKSISGDRSYEAPIRALALRGKTAAEIYEAITVEDIQPRDSSKTSSAPPRFSPSCRRRASPSRPSRSVSSGKACRSSRTPTTACSRPSKPAAPPPADRFDHPSSDRVKGYG